MADAARFCSHDLPATSIHLHPRPSTHLGCGSRRCAELVAAGPTSALRRPTSQATTSIGRRSAAQDVPVWAICRATCARELTFSLRKMVRR